MPLNSKAKIIFDLAVINLTRTMTSQQLTALYSDKINFLNELLGPIRTKLNEQKKNITVLYKTAKNAENDKHAYELKTQIEASEEFLIVSCNEEELLTLLDSSIASLQQNTESLVTHSIFSSLNSAPKTSNSSPDLQQLVLSTNFKV